MRQLYISLVAVSLFSACSGVPKESVREEADVIDRSAQTAEALQTICLDAGTDSPTCGAARKQLEDIRSSAQALKKISK